MSTNIHHIAANVATVECEKISLSISNTFLINQLRFNRAQYHTSTLNISRCIECIRNELLQSCLFCKVNIRFELESLAQTQTDELYQENPALSVFAETHWCKSSNCLMIWVWTFPFAHWADTRTSKPFVDRTRNAHRKIPIFARPAYKTLSRVDISEYTCDMHVATGNRIDVDRNCESLQIPHIVSDGINEITLHYLVDENSVVILKYSATIRWPPSASERIHFRRHGDQNRRRAQQAINNITGGGTSVLRLENNVTWRRRRRHTHMARRRARLAERSKWVCLWRERRTTYTSVMLWHGRNNGVEVLIASANR